MKKNRLLLHQRPCHQLHWRLEVASVKAPATNSGNAIVASQWIFTAGAFGLTFPQEMASSIRAPESEPSFPS